MRRVFLALWLALFAAQATELIAAVAPDGCVEESESPFDLCPDGGCARCICCARVPPCVPQAIVSLGSQPAPEPRAPRSIELPSAADPHGIFHVPKTL